MITATLSNCIQRNSGKMSLTNTLYVERSGEPKEVLAEIISVCEFTQLSDLDLACEKEATWMTVSESSKLSREWVSEIYSVVPSIDLRFNFEKFEPITRTRFVALRACIQLVKHWRNNCVYISTDGAAVVFVYKEAQLILNADFWSGWQNPAALKIVDMPYVTKVLPKP